MLILVIAQQNGWPVDFCVGTRTDYKCRANLIESNVATGIRI